VKIEHDYLSEEDIQTIVEILDRANVPPWKTSPDGKEVSYLIKVGEGYLALVASVESLPSFH
jgi:hypothetical protein